ncbi:hypothetical protein BTVI_138821 [Pitangus sulphuratus]|nr:hypothetical protein BTVI_138821 [Pitangus sulphuratus]
MEKLEVEIKFKNGDIQIVIPETKYVKAATCLVQEITPVTDNIPTEVEDAVVPTMWASGIPGKSERAEPVKITLKPGAIPDNDNLGRKEKKPSVATLNHEQFMNFMPSEECRMLKFQVTLLEQDDVTLKVTLIVSPAMLLSSKQVESAPEYDCLQTIEEAYSSQPDLKDISLENLDWELYTSGSSFVQEGKRLTGYAVTTTDKISKIRQKTSMTWVQVLPITLLRTRVQPRRRDNLNPYELMYDNHG